MVQAEIKGVRGAPQSFGTFATRLTPRNPPLRPCPQNSSQIQSNNISACVKHYQGNSQEYDRSGQSANIPLRAAKELYYKPFAAAVDAGVGNVMCCA